MNSTYRLSFVFIIAASLALLAFGRTPATYPPATKSFSINSDYGARTTFSFQIREPGCVWAKATWTGTAKNLALILNGPGRDTAYKRQDGSSGLLLSYSLNAKDLTAGTNWVLTIANFGGGRANGQIVIEIPPNQIPCEVEAIPGKLPAQIVLNWRYTGKTPPGLFLVERSTDDKTWSRAAATCQLKPSPSRTSFACTDSGGLKSKALYYYHVCAVEASAGRCDTLNASPSISIRAP
jgi:hypothetical protein